MRGMQPSWLLLALCLCRAPIFLGEDILCYYTGNCYMVHTKQLTFSNALSSCGPKGSLTTMKNMQEEREILQLLGHFQSTHDADVFWIGLSKPAKICITSQMKLYGFTWVSGGDETTVNYWTGMPKGTCARRRCAGLQNSSGLLHSRIGNHSWVWKDYPCANTFASICHSKVTWNVSSPQVAEQILYHFTDQYNLDLFPEVSKITILNNGIDGSATFTCDIVNGSYSCIETQCSCIQLNDKGGGSELRRCWEHKNCAEYCLNAANASLPCSDEDSHCEGECAFNISSSPQPQTSKTTKVYSLGNATDITETDDESWFDKLFIPMILGLVALGILVMLVWGGIQMCLRRKKPPRKKSIAPIEHGASDTDSTDHSSSEEEEEEEELQDRTEIP